MRPSPSSRRSWRRSRNWRAWLRARAPRRERCPPRRGGASEARRPWRIAAASADGAERVALLRSGHEALRASSTRSRPPSFPHGHCTNRSRSCASASARDPSFRARSTSNAGLRGGRPRTGAGYRGAGSPGPPSRPHHGSAAARHGVGRADAGTRSRARVSRRALRRLLALAHGPDDLLEPHQQRRLDRVDDGGPAPRGRCVVAVVRWASARWWAAPRSS